MVSLQTSDHEHSEAVALAAEWLIQPRERTGRATVPELRERFGLTVQDALAAIREANLRRARAQ